MNAKTEFWLVKGKEPGTKRFGQLAQRLRRGNELTVQQVSEGTNLSVGTIRAVEQGRRAPSERSGTQLLSYLLPEGSLTERVPARPGSPAMHSFVDPESGNEVVLAFGSKGRGDNQKWSSDRSRVQESELEGSVRVLLEDPDRVSALERSSTMLALVTELAAAEAAEPVSDVMLGQLVRAISNLHMRRAWVLENLLFHWSEVDSGQASDSLRDLVGQVESKIMSVQPFEEP